MSKPENYGSKYWFITGEGDPMTLYADKMIVSNNGDLLAIGGYRKDDASATPDDGDMVMYAVAAGQWHTFHAASQITGGMVCAYDE
jgi:hypothetical protein